MNKLLVLLVGIAIAGVAHAQVKCWTGTNGKRACGDLPPPGARLETPKGAPAPVQPAPAPVETKKAAPARAPQDVRKPQTDVQGEAARTPREKVPNISRMQACDRAQQTLRDMGGGGRSRRTDAVKARAAAEQNCG